MASPPLPGTPSSFCSDAGSLKNKIDHIVSMLDSPIAGTTPENKDDLPPTQVLEQRVLKDIVAYVEVRSQNENRSRCFTRELIQLGAQVVPKFTNDVTHVIFKDGKKTTRDKAKKKGVHLVSVLWVDSCKRTQSHVSENLFKPSSPEESLTPIGIPRLKKVKSMEPKDFDEELAKSAERVKKRLRRQANSDKWKLLETPFSPRMPPTVFVGETQPASPFLMDMTFSPSLTVPDTPPSMRRKLAELKRKEAKLGDSDMEDESTPLHKDKPLPFYRRLFDGNMSGMFSGPGSPETPAPSVSISPPTLPEPSETSNYKDARIDAHSSNERLNEVPKKKHKLFLDIPDVQPPAELIEPTKASKTMQTKGAIIETGKRQGGRKRRNSKSPSCDSIPEKYQQKTKMDEGSEQAKPKKRARVTESKMNPVVNQNTGPPATPLGILRVKRSNRRQSIASSTPTQNPSNIKDDIKVNRRGRRSLTPQSTDFTEKQTPTPEIGMEDVKVNRRSRRSIALQPANFTVKDIPIPEVGVEETKVSRRGRRSMAPQAADLTVKETATAETGMEDIKVNRRGRRSMAPQSAELTVKETVTTNTGVEDIKVNRRGRRSMAPQSAELTVKETATTKTNVEGIKVNRRGRRSMAPQSADLTESVPISLSGTSLSSEMNDDHAETIQTNSDLAIIKLPLAANQDQSSPNCEDDSSRLGHPCSKQSSPQTSKATPVMGHHGVCPADFDSPVDDSVILQPHKRRKLKTVSSARKKKSSESDSDETSSLNPTQSRVNKKFTDPSQTPLPCLSHSRKSLEDFHPSQFNIPLSRKLKGALKTSLGTSDDDSLPGLVRKVRKAVKPGRTSSTSSDDEKRKSKVTVTMVTTSMSSDEKELMRSVTKQLGGFRVTSDVIDSTTHVVCGSARRTLNVLYAIVRGIWLVSKEWVLESLEQGRWLDEEPFEIHDYFPAAQKSRLMRVASEQQPYKPDLFSTCGTLYVADQTCPPHHHLVALVKLGGGQVTQCIRKADICVGGKRRLGPTDVTEQWLLDSITSYRCLPLENYINTDRGQRETSPDF